jgi:hypothetical protein
MKKTIFTITILLISILNVFSSIVIIGKFVNAKSRLVTINYSGSSSSTSPNFFGEKQLSTFLDENDEFKFVLSSKDYCVYHLDRFEILAKEKDSISIFVDFNNIDRSFIAMGRGCGLTNFWFAVEQFKPRRKPKVNNEEIIEYWEKKRQNYFNVLNAFRTGTFSARDSIPNDLIININRLIKESKLTTEEYRLAQNRINYSCVSSAISCTPFEYFIKNSDQFFELFKNMNLTINTINEDYITENLAGKYVWVTCLKKELLENDSVSEEKFVKYFLENENYVAKDILPGNLLQKFVADNLYDILLNGNYEKFRELFNQSKSVFTNSIYPNKLNDFYKNYLSALQNKEFILNSPEKTLNDSTVKVLYNTFKGQKVYLILWKIGDGASYTLTPLFELSSLDIMQKSAPNVKFVDICSGDISSKQHWASLIINHQWKGNHYYYAYGNIGEFKNAFHLEHKMQYCNAKLYYLLDANGDIIKETEGELIEDLK